MDLKPLFHLSEHVLSVPCSSMVALSTFTSVLQRAGKMVLAHSQCYLRWWCKVHTSPSRLVTHLKLNIYLTAYHGAHDLAH